MSTLEDSDRRAREHIRSINDRLLSDLAKERWWHLYVRAGLGAGFTAAIIFLASRFL